MKAFSYERKETVNKKDENGKVIPLTQKTKIQKEDGTEEEVDQPVPGKFVTEDKWVKDVMNLDYFIRVHALTDGRVVVLLDDGHEVTEKVPTLKNKNGRPVPGNIIEEKQRQWIQSEILIAKPEDVERLYKTLEV